MVNVSLAQDYTPPNGVLLKDNLFLDATEVANIHWLEYEYYIRADSGDAYADMNIPNQELTKNYRPDYYSNPDYRYFPVIGITYEQAMNYCDWRSEVVNIKLEEQGVIHRVKFRLPTEKEWELAAKKMDTVQNDIPPKTEVESLLKRGMRKEVRNLFPEREMNFKKLKAQIVSYSKVKVLAYNIDYEKPWFITNEEKLPQIISENIDLNPSVYFHLIGNVAEMVQEKGIVKGGSWRHKLAVSFPSKKILVDPEKVYDWVGFRCVAEVYTID